MKIYIVGIIALILVSCTNQENVIVENVEKPFFDIKGFFEKEIAESKLTKLEKKVRINGTSETKVLTSFDLKKELSMFVNSDINKPSLFDKYNSYITKRETIYKTLDENLSVQKIEIKETLNGDIEKIVIYRKANTQIYTSDKILTYEPNKGFSIKNAQKVLFSNKKDYEIEVTF